MPPHYKLIHKTQKKSEKAINRQLSFLQKAQIVAAFEPSTSTGHTLIESRAPYLSGSTINSPSPKTILAFLEDEGIVPQVHFKKISISSIDYHKLEDRYTIPLSPKDIQTALKKFDGDGHSAEFINSSWAFGTNF